VCLCLKRTILSVLGKGVVHSCVHTRSVLVLQDIGSCTMRQQYHLLRCNVGYSVPPGYLKCNTYVLCKQRGIITHNSCLCFVWITICLGVHPGKPLLRNRGSKMRVRSGYHKVRNTYTMKPRYVAFLCRRNVVCVTLHNIDKACY